MDAQRAKDDWWFFRMGAVAGLFAGLMFGFIIGVESSR
jgi:hypothetical protein